MLTAIWHEWSKRVCVYVAVYADLVNFPAGYIIGLAENGPITFVNCRK